MKFSKFIVVLVIFLNVVFTSAALYVFYLVGEEPAATVAAWFSFTTIEVWGLSKITRDKEKAKIEKNNQRPTI